VSWRCPRCGRRFVSRDMPHSCVAATVDGHFAAAAPGLRETFDAFVAAARESGPVEVDPTVSRIALLAAIRFAAVQRPRGRHLDAHLVLTRPVRSPRLKVEFLAPYYYLHRVRLRTPADVDDELRGWLAEAHEVGRRRHVRDPQWPKERTPPDWVARPGR
jgi:hypothetical protein